MTDTLKVMLNNNAGYRTEGFSGSDVRNAREIIGFEISELQNDDIIEYMHTHYGILMGYYHDDEEEFLNACHANVDDVVDHLMLFITPFFDCSDQSFLTALWLTTYDNVKKHYGGTADEPGIYIDNGGVDKYVIPDKHLVISDLGEEGSLFVFDEPLLPISSWTN
mgnify:CR=1 FL=1